jgi:hypothetical protein
LEYARTVAMNSDGSPTRLELAAAYEAEQRRREEKKDAALRAAREYLEALPEAYDVESVLELIEWALK